MNMFLIILVFLRCTLTLIGADSTLEHHMRQSDLNPIYDNNNNNLNREHDKRTIFNTGLRNPGWVKHIGQRPSGLRYVIGYGPVDFKYVPVLRPPIRLVNHRPRWPLKIVKPIIPIKPIQDGWKPVQPILIKPVVPVQQLAPVVKPVVPVVKPAVPIAAQPCCTQHAEWKPKPVVAPAPVNVVPVQPLPSPPIVPVQQFLPTQQLVPVHQIPNPWLPSVKPAYPLVPDQQALPVPSAVVPAFKPTYPQFFEVAKPKLPVVLLGARYPVIQQIPTGSKHFMSNKIYTAPVLGSGVIYQKPQVFFQNPGKVVTYQQHTIHNLIPTNVLSSPKGITYTPQFVQSFPHPPPPLIQTPGVQFHVQPHQPNEHGQVIPIPSHQQPLPHAHIQQGQLVDQQYLPPLAHGQLPLEGENSAVQEQQSQFTSGIFSTAQEQSYYDDNQVEQEQQFQSPNVIQPGQTDVQTPLYLPPHPNFKGQVENLDGYQSQFSTSQDDGLNGFRPSPVLESPFNHFNRREFVVENDETKGNGTKNHHD